MRKVIGSVLIIIVQILTGILGFGIYELVWNKVLQVLIMILALVVLDVIMSIFIIDSFIFKISKRLE